MLAEAEPWVDRLVVRPQESMVMYAGMCWLPVNFSQEVADRIRNRKRKKRFAQRVKQILIQAVWFFRYNERFRGADIVRQSKKTVVFYRCFFRRQPSNG
jgi:hypothetical protein